MEPTGILSFVLAFMYVVTFGVACTRWGDSEKTHKKGGLLLVFILTIWGVVGTVAYMADKQCLPYSGALECYYEN